jgi:protein dithiol oxidoreductase (disulfide-forming)
MSKELSMLVRILVVLALLAPVPALAQMRWQEGVQYTTLVNTAPAKARAGKIEVAEVFSYGCIHCFRAKDAMTKLKDSLPSDAVMTYVHASFNPAEAWPVFQRGWYTALSLGIGEAMHDRIFDAVWTNGELALVDPATGALRKPLPTIADIARVYAKYSSVNAADFLRQAQSPLVEAQLKAVDALIMSWRIPGTPSLVVNGRYLVNNSNLRSWDEMRDVVNYLVSLERRRLKLPAVAKP